MKNKIVFGIIFLLGLLVISTSCEQKVDPLENEPTVIKTNEVAMLINFGHVSPYIGPDCMKANGFCGDPCGIFPTSDCAEPLLDQAISIVTFDEEESEISIDISEFNLSTELATLFFEEKKFPVDEDFSLRKDLLNLIFENSGVDFDDEVMIEKGIYEVVRKEIGFEVCIPVKIPNPAFGFPITIAKVCITIRI